MAQKEPLSLSQRKTHLSKQCNFSGRAGLSHLKQGKHEGKGRFCPHCCFQISRLMWPRCTTAPILTSSPRSKSKDLDLKLVALLPAKTEEPWSWRNSWWMWVKIILLMNFPVKYLTAYTYLRHFTFYEIVTQIQTWHTRTVLLSGKEVIFF